MFLWCHDTDKIIHRSSLEWPLLSLNKINERDIFCNVLCQHFVSAPETWPPIFQTVNPQKRIAFLGRGAASLGPCGKIQQAPLRCQLFPVWQHFQKVGCLGLANRLNGSNRPQIVIINQKWICRCWGDGVSKRSSRRRRRKHRLVWRSDAMPRNTADILTEGWETRDGWIDGEREREREVEGQPQPHVKCGAGIWTAPSLPLLFHSVHNLTTVHCTCNLMCDLYPIHSLVIFLSLSLPPSISLCPLPFFFFWIFISSVLVFFCLVLSFDLWLDLCMNTMRVKGLPILHNSSKQPPF